MNSYAISLGLHLGAGTLALACFWTAALARKGSRPRVPVRDACGDPHRRAVGPCHG